MMHRRPDRREAAFDELLWGIVGELASRPSEPVPDSEDDEVLVLDLEPESEPERFVDPGRHPVAPARPVLAHVLAAITAIGVAFGVGRGVRPATEVAVALDGIPEPQFEMMERPSTVLAPASPSPPRTVADPVIAAEAPSDLPTEDVRRPAAPVERKKRRARSKAPAPAPSPKVAFEDL